MHRKVRPLPDAAFRLHLSGLCWSARHLTDGFIPEGELPFISDVQSPDKAVRHLENRCLWVPGALGWHIHDYLEYNPPASEIEAARTRKSAAAQRAARIRWGHR